MKLHHNAKLFQDAIRITAQQLNIPPEFIEKDYWVTYALHTIFNHEIGKDSVFKGGTSLSKCYKLIDRFSEDIDLVVLRRTGETDSKLKSKLHAISRVVDKVLPEVRLDGITHKRGMNRKTAHAYNKTFQNDYEQVRDLIILESTWFGYYEPYTTKSIVSFVGQMIIDNKQADLAREHGLLPFEVLVLEPTRTLCEKIMSLVRFSYGIEPIADLKKKIRHTYDLHQLLKQDALKAFLHSKAFDKMLLKVARDDVASFKNNNKWLIHHPADALLFKDLENAWKELKPIYNAHFKNLVYGEFPKDEAVLKTLITIRKRLIQVKWTIAL